MKIRIKENASMIYINRTAQGLQLTNTHWAYLLEQIEGKIIEVETEYLFKDQFSTVPIPNISESGMRVMMESVAEVIDDLRPQKMRCNWCGKTSDKGLACEHCNKKRYLEYL